MTEYFEVEPQYDLKSMNTFLENKSYYEALKKLALENKTIDGYSKGLYTVKKLSELDMGMECYQNIFYQVELPKEAVEYLTHKLIVFFMPADNMESPDAKKRMFGSFSWDSLSGSIAKNTYILRIADTNLISGSYYQNTVNFPDFERKIQDLIKRIAEKYDIESCNIVCYGNSRGGTAGLYHALLGKYKCVVADPVIDRRAWVEVKDTQHMFDLIDYNMSEKINYLLRQSKQRPEDFQIVASDSVFITFPYIKQLYLNKVNLNNLRLNNPATTTLFMSHAMLIGKSIPFQLSLINQLLYSSDIKIEYDTEQFNYDTWDALLPWSNPYFETNLYADGLKVTRNKEEFSEKEKWMNLLLRRGGLKAKETYILEIQTDSPDLLKTKPLYLHDMNYFEVMNLDSIHGSVLKYKIKPKKALKYLGFNAVSWNSNEVVRIQSIKMKKENE